MNNGGSMNSYSTGSNSIPSYRTAGSYSTGGGGGGGGGNHGNNSNMMMMNQNNNMNNGNNNNRMQGNITKIFIKNVS